MYRWEIGHLRHCRLVEHKHRVFGHTLKPVAITLEIDALDDDNGEDLLRLIFSACYPMLSTEARHMHAHRRAGVPRTHSGAHV